MKPLERRWLALFVLCLSTLMIVLDTTIVNVALPSIKASLGFSDASLAWVVNAYALTFAGFLLLGGRLGDLYGQRRLFLAGLALFTLASLACGFASSQFMLIAARAVQGIGGAMTDAIALSLVMNLFPEQDERAKAMGVFGFVAAGGGSVGALLGGVLTDAFNWHWIFLVNLPIGIAVFALSLWLLSGEHVPPKLPHLDAAGAAVITLSLMLAVYGIVNGNAEGWLSARTVGTLVAAAAGIGFFLFLERAAKAPLMPLSLFSVRSFAVANAVGILWSASMFSWFFLSALYMQLVLHYDPLHVGLAFLPANLIMAALSISLSAKIVGRFGVKRSLTAGMMLCAAGLFLFARVPVDGNFLFDILPPMLLMGLGAGISFNPMLLSAMNDVPQDESGLASGIVNTAFMFGGSLGLAILASVASARTSEFISRGVGESSALAGGYGAAFFVGAVFAAIAALLSGLLLRSRMPTAKA